MDTVQPIKVLLINRELTFLEYISKRLKRSGCSPLQTVNGEEALALSVNTSLDVALIDNDLPGMKAGEVFNRIKELQPYLQGILLFDREKEVSSVLENCKFAPFQYLLKPSDFETLLQNVTAAYEHKMELLKSSPQQPLKSAQTSKSFLGLLQRLLECYSLPKGI